MTIRGVAEHFYFKCSGCQAVAISHEELSLTDHPRAGSAVKPWEVCGGCPPGEVVNFGDEAVCSHCGNKVPILEFASLLDPHPHRGTILELCLQRSLDRQVELVIGRDSRLVYVPAAAGSELSSL